MARQADIHQATAVVTAPTDLVVSLDAAKRFLRVTHEHEDTIIRACIMAATPAIQEWTGRQLLQATFDHRLDCWPDGPVTLPWPPVQSITSVSYYDSDGAVQVWDSANYQLDASAPARLAPVPGQSYPGIQSGRLLPITIRMVCGATAQELIPSELVQAVLVMTEHLYTNRELMVTGTIATEIPFTVSALIDTWRLTWADR